MKKLLVMALMISSISLTATGGEFVKKHGESVGASYSALTVAGMVYASLGGVASMIASGTLAVAVSRIEWKAQQEQALKLLADDIQSFYQDGSVSLNLQNSIDFLREADDTLSESEALDGLTRIVESSL